MIGDDYRPIGMFTGGDFPLEYRFPQALYSVLGLRAP